MSRAPAGGAEVIELPGEKHIVRTELGAKAKKGRANRRKALLAFAQLSDVHIIDAQSPIRIENGEAVSSSASRPQEILSGQVADAMVREINEIGRRPGDRRSRWRSPSRPATTPTPRSTTRSAGTSTSSTAAR